VLVGLSASVESSSRQKAYRFPLLLHPKRSESDADAGLLACEDLDRLAQLQNRFQA
jgi:hypothetical protein